MKTCRFCNHEQEEGDRCEAFGSPFSADKLDFSGETMPDPTQSVTSAQDSSIWGAASSESPVAETSVPQPAVVETTMPEAETVSSDASVTGAPDQKAPEADVPKTDPQPTPPKIMYSAAARS